MKKKTRDKKPDELRREYDFSRLEGRVVGKYYERCKAGPIVVLLKPDDEKLASPPRSRGTRRPTTAAKRRKKAKPSAGRTTRRSK